MALTCTQLNASLALNCDDAPLAGLEPAVYAMNLADIATSPVVGSGDNTISAITLNSTKVAYKWEGGPDSVQATYELRAGRILSGFGHSVNLIVPQDDQAARTELTNLANGRTVWVVEKRGDASNKFLVYGLKHGLDLTEVAGDETNTDTDGLPTITLTTPDGYKEKLVPQVLLATDYPGTKTMLENLLTA